MGHAEILEIKFVAINILKRKRLMLRVNSRIAELNSESANWKVTLRKSF